MHGREAATDGRTAALLKLLLLLLLLRRPRLQQLVVRGTSLLLLLLSNLLRSNRILDYRRPHRLRALALDLSVSDEILHVLK